MSKLFKISLDQLVFGKKEKEQTNAAIPPLRFSSIRINIGCVQLLFGMVFFLLSVFFGDHLYLGEEFGELVSICIVLISIAFLTTYNSTVLSICFIIYFIYNVICTGIIHVSSMTNHIFLFVTGIVLLVWFIIFGLHITKEQKTA